MLGPEVRDWSVRGGGLQNGKIAGLKLFVPPPPQDSVNFFVTPFRAETV